MSYEPTGALKDAEVDRELRAIAQEFNALGKMKVAFREPDKPRDGNFCVCDGVLWNPLGDGIKRAIWFNGTTWQAF